MIANFIGIEVSNPHWSQLGNKVKSELLDWIEFSKLDQFNTGSIYETQPHITLIYNESLNKGPNWLHWFMTVKNRDLYKQLVSIDSLSIKDVTIDTFDNPDSKVLKINCLDSNIIDICREYHDRLDEIALERSKYNIYRPHLTITYLKPDTPDSVIEDFKSKIVLKNYTEFKLENILITDTDHEFKIKIE